ncbi:hypothetical protein ALQ89_03222 [Pseudomonas amygdali pv. tabaci]|uniref:Uncharacterized protein n=1 Tax=Pseudomonas amygdali pv. tabaci TaxID=322 RepID=A0AAX1VWR1_PSEAJ|nr:hypothetical protein ALQ89_03222 [Pseudomonas amygdali pv. tabaci]
MHGIPRTYVHATLSNIAATKATKKPLFSRLSGKPQPWAILTIRDQELPIWCTLGFVLGELGFTVNRFMEGVHILYFCLHSFIEPFVKIG